LGRQIEEAAPVNAFASADQKWMDYLAEKNLIVPDTRKDLLGNDLVLVVPADKPRHVTIDPGFDLLACSDRMVASRRVIRRMFRSASMPSRRSRS
jgi:ABC-type molybdate transport system substrate-binding protein